MEVEYEGVKRCQVDQVRGERGCRVDQVRVERGCLKASTLHFAPVTLYVYFYFDYALIALNNWTQLVSQETDLFPKVTKSYFCHQYNCSI